MKKAYWIAALIPTTFLALVYLSTAVPAIAEPREGWVSVGPYGDSLGGQVNAIAIDPTDSSTIYIGASDGGVWKTSDGGGSWSPVSDSAPRSQLLFLRG